MRSDRDSLFSHYISESSTTKETDVQLTDASDTGETDIFGKYGPDSQTIEATPSMIVFSNEKSKSVKYGIAKPFRIITRGTIAADKGPEKE